jgi:cell wall-associated NlpC family hydrolase
MGPLLSTFISATFIATSILPTEKPVPIINSVQILATADKYIGVPYCRGGSRGKCFDCSGFTSFVYGKYGVALSRSASQQYRDAVIISKKTAVPGDLVFFKNKNGYVYHVGIYLGNNKIIHAPRYGKRVRVETIWGKRIEFAKVAYVTAT